MLVRLQRGFVLDGVTYRAQLQGVEIPNHVSRLSKDFKPETWPVVEFSKWKDGDAAVPLPGDAILLSDEDAAAAEAVEQQKLHAAQNKPMALSEMAKISAGDPVKLGGKTV